MNSNNKLEESVTNTNPCEPVIIINTCFAWLILKKKKLLKYEEMHMPKYLK